MGMVNMGRRWAIILKSSCRSILKRRFDSCWKLTLMVCKRNKKMRLSTLTKSVSPLITPFWTVMMSYSTASWTSVSVDPPASPSWPWAKSYSVQMLEIQGELLWRRSRGRTMAKSPPKPFHVIKSLARQMRLQGFRSMGAESTRLEILITTQSAPFESGWRTRTSRALPWPGHLEIRSHQELEWQQNQVSTIFHNWLTFFSRNPWAWPLPRW